MSASVALTDVISRAELLALFQRLAADPELEARFLDDPAATLADEVGWSRPPQRVSTDNALLVQLLRTPGLRATLRDCRAGADVTQATITSSSASTTSTSSFSSSTVTSASASVSTSANFTTGGVNGGPAAGVDASTLRLLINEIAAEVTVKVDRPGR